jgi:HlyD family secretion protein
MKKGTTNQTGKKKMKKGIKRLIIIGVAVIVAVSGYFIYDSASNTAKAETKYSAEGSFDQATIGDISLTVSGNGNLTSGKTINVTSDSQIIAEDVLVAEGDSVTEGQPLIKLDTDAMQSYADDLQEQISQQQISIDTTNQVTTNLNIKSPVDGWVKNVELDEDDYIEDAMAEHDYVALVATEKREIIAVPDGVSLAEGTTVKVKCEGYAHTGTVTKENGKLYVSIDTVKRTVGATAIIYDTDGNKLYEGAIELAAYVPIESTYGVITKVNFSEDEAIDAGETIYSASQYSQDVKDMYAKLADLKEEYDNVTALVSTGQFTAPSAGVISSVLVTAGQTVDADTILLTIASTDNWIATVSVDELDINSIKVGQSVEVTMDSLPNETFEGTVADISDMGTASGGITTYDVNVSVEDNDEFKINMTVSCEIKSEEANNAVLIPVDDVRTAGDKSYVMVETDRTDAEKAAIRQLISDSDWTGLADYMGDDAKTLGITALSTPTELLYSEVRAVEVGIESSSYTEIKSGLAEGEKVVKTESSSSSAGQFQFGMGGGEMGGGNFSGGNAPGGNMGGFSGGNRGGN